MKPSKHFVILFLTMLSAVGCKQSDAAHAQLLVEVTAEPGLASRLQRVTAFAVPADVRSRVGADVHEFSLVKGKGAGVEVTLPFSFAVAQGDAESVLLVVEGFESSERDAASVIEHKLITSFQAGVTRKLTVELTDACADRVCSALTETCSTESKGCVDVESGERTSGRVPDAGYTDAGMDAAMAPPAPHPSGKDAATANKDAGRPTANTQADASATGSSSQTTEGVSADDADGGPELSVCDQPNSCAAPYPCVANDTGGYSCQGQLADWPMPDPASGSKNPPSYDYARIPDVVIDNVTKLEWQRITPDVYPGCSGRDQVPGDTCTWEEAKNYCRQLDLASGGWRLPSKIELESLFGDTSQVPAVDSAAFPNLSGAERNWSVSPAQGKIDGLAWLVYSGMGMSNADDPVETFEVRCVRGGARGTATPAERYQRNQTANSVTDIQTKLEWQLEFGDADTVEAAREYCSSQNDRWRLPSLKELLTLLDPKRDEPATHSVFRRIPIGGMFWTNTPMVPLADPQYMAVDFSAGMAMGSELLRSSEDQVRFTFHARCVR